MDHAAAKHEPEGVKAHWTAPPWRWRWGRGKIGDAPLLLALLLWVCALPLILLLTIPFFGLTVGVSAALVALIAILLVCLGICSSPSHGDDITTQPPQS
ncbi:MAG: hypothetical protein ACRDFT_08180 [bacterium]